jgi:hypothetical protein
VAKNIAAGPGTPKEMASADCEPKTGLRKSSQGYHYSLMEENSKINCFFSSIPQIFKRNLFRVCACFVVKRHWRFETIF